MFGKIVSRLILVCIFTGIVLPQTAYNSALESSFQVRLTDSNANKGTTDRIHAVMKLYNEGNTAIDLSKVRVRYYFNLDGDPSKVAPNVQKAEGKVYNYQSDRSNPYEYVISRLPCSFVNMGQSSTGSANIYIEMGFPQNYAINGKAPQKISHVDIDMEITKDILSGVTGDTSQLRNFIQQNHYSYNAGNEMDWPKVTVYYDGELIYGTPPVNQVLGTPSGLTAWLEGKTVMLQWTAAAGAQSYEIYRSDSINGEFAKIAEGIRTTAYNDATVPETRDQNGKRYYYKVAAVSGGQRSPGSNIASVTVYPCVNTGLGLFRYNIINNSGRPKPDFVLGSYIPLVMELKLSDNLTDPAFKVIKDITSGDERASPFTAAILPNYSRKLFINSELKNSGLITTGQNNDLKISGNYLRNDVIRIEFALKISSKENLGIEQLYGKFYKLGFEISGFRGGSFIRAAGDNSGKPFSLEIKVLNPNKLN